VKRNVKMIGHEAVDEYFALIPVGRAPEGLAEDPDDIAADEKILLSCDAGGEARRNLTPIRLQR
jgi:hypothetical protein